MPALSRSLANLESFLNVCVVYRQQRDQAKGDWGGASLHPLFLRNVFRKVLVKVLET